MKEKYTNITQILFSVAFKSLNKNKHDKFCLKLMCIKSFQEFNENFNWCLTMRPNFFRLFVSSKYRFYFKFSFSI